MECLNNGGKSDYGGKSQPMRTLLLGNGGKKPNSWEGVPSCFFFDQMEVW